VYELSRFASKTTPAPEKALSGVKRRTASPFLQRPTPAVAPVTSKMHGAPVVAARTNDVTASSKSSPPRVLF
jgi:hypothetical protein